MQKKTKRLITLLLAVVMVAGLLTAGLTAGANAGTMDLDGDGRVTIHDVQLAKESEDSGRQLSSSQQEAMAKGEYTRDDIFARILGINRSHTPAISGGVYQIGSIKDLGFVQQNSTKGYSFKLTKDIDLGGMGWTPIDQFTGTFDGNNKTISNLVITTGQKNSYKGGPDEYDNLENQGFFAEIMAGATVKNLNLRSVEITASEKANFMGLLAGTNRGTVTGCYTHGKITDRREVGNPVDGGTMVAALIGRNVGAGKYSTVTGHYATEPTVEGTTTKYLWKSNPDRLAEDTGKIPIAAQLAVDVADRSDITVCLSFNDPTNSTVTQFQEISGAYGVDAATREKQAVVVDYMEAMALVKWKTPTTLTKVVGGDDEIDGTGDGKNDETWKSGVTWTGLPFTGMHSGLERFQSIATYSNGVYTLDANKAAEVKSGQSKASDWYTSINETSETAKEQGWNGWIRYIGNDCSSAVSWAWLQISPVDAYRNYKTGKIDGKGVYIDTCRHSFAYLELEINNNDHYGHQHGIVQLGNYSFNELNEDGTIKTPFLSATVASKEPEKGGDGVGGTTATTSKDIWEWNANQSSTSEKYRYRKLYETYGQARKGDAIQTWFTGVKDTSKPGAYDNRVWEGHMRLLAEDPVVIRDRNGDVDIDSSYIITHEHGGAVGNRQTNASNEKTAYTNHWGLFQKYRLTDLDVNVPNDCVNANNSNRCYLPITCDALRDEGQVAQTYSFTKNPASGEFVPAEAPYTGSIYTNYAVYSVTVRVYDSADNLVLEENVTNMPDGNVRSTQSLARYSGHRQKEIRLAEQFGYLQKDSRLKVGTTYTCEFDLYAVTDQLDPESGTWSENSVITTSRLSFTHKPA